jgi:glutamate-ammonia-ligase adenylyltransferase
MPSLAEIAETSRYLARLLAARPALAAEVEASLGQPVTAAELSAWLAAQPVGEANLKPVLRQLKQRAYARIAARDLAGLAPLGEVVECMTLIAELAVGKAPRFSARGWPNATARRAAPTGEAQELIVIGMGKLGGRELNVSSDIDLIFVYPEDGDTDGAANRFRISNSSPASAAA